MHEAHLRQFFDTQLAASALAIQREAQRTARFRLLRRSVASADEQLRQRFATELARPVVEQLRPGWMYDTEPSLTRDELFASTLFQRIALTRFDVTMRIRGLAHALPFEMHEVTATGEGERQYMRILLIGFLAHVKLPWRMPGHIRFCHHQADKTWRRPAMEGYRSVGVAALEGLYHVDATPDAPPLASLPGLVASMDDLGRSGWHVHVALGGLSAWVAIEQSRTWFEPRSSPPYSADDLLQLDRAFEVFERVAGALNAVRHANAS
jgi:hypothetical protein